MVSRAQVTEAVNYLIGSDSYARLVKEMENVIERWHERPMVYAGDLAVLNALIDVGVENREAFNRLIELVEQKRKLLPELRRVDYQRELMRERRAREAKAIELHELTTGRKIVGKERDKFVKELRARWRRERDAYIRSKGKLDWSARNAAANEFWTMVDHKLDANLRGAQARTPKP